MEDSRKRARCRALSSPLPQFSPSSSPPRPSSSTGRIGAEKSTRESSRQAVNAPASSPAETPAEPARRMAAMLGRWQRNLPCKRRPRRLRQPEGTERRRSQPSTSCAIEPTGEALIAGQATPGSDVEILANGIVIARATADADGAFLAMPAEALAAGEHQFALRQAGTTAERRARAACRRDRAGGHPRRAGRASRAASGNGPAGDGARRVQRDQPRRACRLRGEGRARHAALDARRVDAGGPRRAAGRRSVGGSRTTCFRGSFRRSIGCRLGIDPDARRGR